MDETVLVPVPRVLLQDVYALLAERMASTSTDQDPAAGERNETRLPNRVDEPRPWTLPGDQELLEDWWNETNPQLRIVLLTLADRPDEWLWVHDLHEALKSAGYPDTEWRSVAALLGALTRRLASAYNRLWPFEAVKDRDMRRWRYRMGPDMADAFKQFAGNSRA